MIRTGLAILALVGLAGAAAAQDVPLGGPQAFKKCMPCHAVGPDAPSKVGPPLNGLLDQPIAMTPNFAYSDVLRNAGANGEVWSIDMLRHYLRSPKKLFPGTKMTFAGLRNDDDLKAMLDFLASIDADGDIKPAP